MYETKIQELYNKLIKKDWICFDIGGYDGAHARALAELAPQGKVFSFEACPGNFATLRTNVANYNNIFIKEMAISNITGRTNLHYGKLNGSAEFNIRGKDVDEKPTAVHCEVAVDSIDHFFNLNQHVDFIKIDVEGVENLVLDGMRQTLMKYRPALIIEFHNDEGWEGSKVLVECQYKILNVYSELSECKYLVERECYHGLAIPKESNILL